MSDFVASGKVPYPEIVKPIWDEINQINEIYGTDYQPPFKE